MPDLVRAVYEGHSGGNPIFHGPRWLGILLAVSVAALIMLRDSAWSIVFLVVVILFGWLPYLAQRVIALWKTPRSFRDGLRED